jgi:SPP1 family predicted phage head-tail adaptor
MVRRGMPKDFKIGDLKHCVRIQKPILTSDAMGGQTESWEDVFHGFAFIQPLRANQRLFAQRLNHETTHRVVLRHCSGVTSKQRILYEGRVLWVQGVVNVDEANRFLEVLCNEGTAS